MLIEPYKIKVVEPIRLISRETREARLREAYFNLFNLKAEDVYIDLLTDSGTAAMSDAQWAGLMQGDESYAGAKSFYRFEETVRKIFGYRHVIPVHQGRGAEHVFFRALLKPGDIVLANSHFDTTRANVEHRGAIAQDCLVAEGWDVDSDYPFKGNIDLAQVEETIRTHGKEKIPLCLLTITNNAGGGQPVSLENMRSLRALLKPHGIPLFFDAARFAENAYFIKTREAGYRDKSIPEICREMFACADGCLMSAKKDGLANIGAFAAVNDDDLAQGIKNNLVLFEGFPTYGGLAGRDLEAIARGLEEVLDEGYLSFRVGQVAFLGRRLSEMGVPILKPVGGHAVFVDAGRFLPHIPRDEFPGQALVVALYREGGIRAVEIGSLSFGGASPVSGEKHRVIAELVRLAIPRRVYTNAHLDYVVATIETIARKRDSLRGFAITYEPQVLRHFSVKLMEINEKTVRKTAVGV